MTVSIIIPTYNRAETLKITLSSIYQQVDLEGAEVIVVDNGSTDDTAYVCKEFTKKYLPSLKYHYDAEPGLLTGRHAGASIATGEILCFLDDDVDLNPLWMKGVKDAFKDDEVQLATGPCLPKYKTDPPKWLNYLWDNLYGGKACMWLSLLDLGDKIIDIHPSYVWGLNFCIRKAALYNLGGFHPDSIPDRLQMFQGDGETGLTIKAYKMNYKAIYHPQIMLHHIVSPQRLSATYFKKRAYFQGICNSFTNLKEGYQNNKKNRTITSLYKILRKIMQDWKNKLKLILLNPKEIRILKKELRKKELEGYYFHQQAFKTNEKVKKWVLQKNYWNYKLPA